MRIPIASAALALALPTGAWAHERNIDLHVGTAYESCYFDLHPELTEDQFQTLGAGNFEAEVSDLTAFALRVGGRF